MSAGIKQREITLLKLSSYRTEGFMYLYDDN
jgi:hypothetical protein